MRVVNLKDGMPLVREALSQMERELRRARSEGVMLLKLIHGYGSTGQGGEIRSAVQSELMQQLQRRELRNVIFGEDWRISNERAWEIVKKWPALKQDSDIGRENRGVTIVVL